MTTPNVHQAAVPAAALSGTKAALWLSLTAFLALMALYLIGVYQGATSSLGADSAPVMRVTGTARRRARSSATKGACVRA